MAGPGVIRAQQPSALAFTDISAAAGIDEQSGSHGAMWADITGDGLPDLYMTYNNVRDLADPYRDNQFYRNLGNGQFVEETHLRGIGLYGGGTHGAAWSDLDNDGDYDLVAALTYKTVTDPFLAEPNRIYRNDNGVFVDATPPPMANYPAYTRSILTFDIDRDGDQDVFAVNGDQGSNEPLPDRNELYINNGGFNFTGITSGILITAPSGQGATDTDYDLDGDIDLLVCNRNGDMNILRNDGGGVFTAVDPASVGIYNVPPPPPGVLHRAYSGISTGDLDNDGDLDLVFIEQSLVTTAARVAHVYHRVGGSYVYRQMIDGFSGMTAGLADLDNDRDLDLVLPGYPVVLLNNGSGTFVPGPPFPGPASGWPEPDVRSVAFADIDLDGDVDFAITAKSGRPYIVRNDFNAGEWLKVGLFAPQGQVGAFGAKIRVFAAGTSTQLGFREVKSSTGYLAQDDPIVHFGLGGTTNVDVRVTYLDGTVVNVLNVNSRRALILNGANILHPPAAPQNLTSSVVGNSVSLTWTPNAFGGAVGDYVLEAGTGPGLSNLAVLSVGKTFSFSTGAPAGVYYVRMRARNLAGTSPASNEVVVRIGGACAGPPAAPSSLGASVNGFNVTFNWVGTPSSEPTTVYQFEAGSAPGLADLATFETVQSTLSSAPPPGRYYTRVRARNACGMSGPSNEIVVQVGCQGPPGTPTGLSASVSGSLVTLNWSAGSGSAADHYMIEVGYSSGSTTFVLNTPNAATSLQGSAPPGTYYVRVRAQNACGTSNPSNQVVVTVN
jgi:ASPIC/UnbV protein/VCBS repeat protein/fibronectin type III domain protein